MSRMSVATIDSPEFINITSINPLVSKCEIKVLYVGENRNRSFITKEVATEMAQTLPGCPIVGYYIENKEDFGDHGEQVIIDAEGVKFNKLTKPYGFIAPNTRVWFQKFNDTDEFGKTITREYLMTEGFLWTGQFPECQMAVTEGRPQSMELDEKTLKGYWSTNDNYGVEFFIINDGMFSKLCILGEDVEPCFEGAKISAPEVSATFSKNDNFVASLYSMMKDLKELTFSLQQDKGGTSMADQEINKTETEFAAPEENKVEETKDFSAEQDKNVSDAKEENQNNTEATEFKKDDDKEESKEENKEDESEEKNDNTEEKEEDDDKEKKASANHSLEEKFALLEQELNQLKQDYAKLEDQNTELSNFKKEVETEKKQDLINSFYMLSDEDKKDVVENMSEYTLDEIEAKLSVIGRRKGVNFSIEENKKEEKEEQPLPLTYNLENDADCGLPAWLKAVEEKRKATN